MIGALPGFAEHVHHLMPCDQWSIYLGTHAGRILSGMTIDGAIHVSGDDPYDTPRMYEVIPEDGYRGFPQGDTMVLDENDPVIVYGLENGLLRLLENSASDDGN